jgi:hypothetical protein
LGDYYLHLDYAMRGPELVLQGEVTSTDDTPRMALVKGRANENCVVTMGVTREPLGTVESGFIDIVIPCSSLLAIDVGDEIWVAAVRFQGESLGLPEPDSTEALLLPASDSIVPLTAVTMLHRHDASSPWLNALFTNERACLGHAANAWEAAADAEGYTLGIGNCDDSLQPQLIAILESAVPDSSEGLSVKGKVTNDHVPN